MTLPGVTRQIICMKNPLHVFVIDSEILIAVEIASLVTRFFEWGATALTWSQFSELGIPQDAGLLISDIDDAPASCRALIVCRVHSGLPWIQLTTEPDNPAIDPNHLIIFKPFNEQTLRDVLSQATHRFKLESDRWGYR
jgi:hypothetical protein